MKTLKRFFLLLFIFTNFLFAQAEGALPFTTMQQSPLLLGAGQIGAAIPNDNVLGFYFNPAILGYSARNNHASISIMPTKTDWILPYGIESDFTFNNYGLNLGYNFNNSKINLPVTIGLGYLHHKFDYGKLPVSTVENPEGIGEVEAYDLFDSFSLGIGIDYYLKFHVGISLKSFDSKRETINIKDFPEGFSVDGTMFDYGALVILPISDLWMSNFTSDIDKSTSISPIANLSFGYSLTNFGDEIYYIDPAQSDPLSRTARLGYTFELGMKLQLNSTKLNLFKYSFSAEANDILVNQRVTDDGYFVENYKMYQGVLGDIDFIDHVINLKSDEKVIVHKGHIFRFFDTVILTAGSFRGKSSPAPRKTSGFGFTSNGLFKLLTNQIENPSIKYILNHFIVKYFKSNVEFIKKRKTTFDNLSIHFKGFEL